MIDNTELIWDLKHQAVWQILPIQVLIVLSRIFGPDSDTVKNAHWKMHPLLVDDIMNRFSQVLTINWLTICKREVPTIDMSYTFGGRPLERDCQMEPHMIVLLSGDKALLKIINVAHREML